MEPGREMTFEQVWSGTVSIGRWWVLASFF
jgi:hypothetical protein